MDVAGWLEGIGLGQYADAFAENHVDAELSDNLSDADLKELGVASLGHRKKILAAIAVELRLTRQLGARRFEAANYEMRGRRLLALGHRNEAVAAMREALSICETAGMQFCGPKVYSALATTVDTSTERISLLAAGEDLLRRGAVGHNHLWFYRDAMEAMLLAKEWARARHFADVLDDYVRVEPLPWSSLFAARARALATAGEGDTSESTRRDLTHVRSALADAGLCAMLGPLDTALAAFNRSP